MSLQTLNASFQRVASMLVRGQVKPLPALVYGFSDIAVALGQFSTAKHVGKIVVTVPAALDAQRVRHLFGL